MRFRHLPSVYTCHRLAVADGRPTPTLPQACRLHATTRRPGASRLIAGPFLSPGRLLLPLPLPVQAILVAVLESQCDDDNEVMEVRLGMGKYACLYDCHADLSDLEERALLVYTGSPEAREVRPRTLTLTLPASWRVRDAVKRSQRCVSFLETSDFDQFLTI